MMIKQKQRYDPKGARMLVSVMLFLTKDDLANLTLRDESRLFVLDNSF